MKINYLTIEVYKDNAIGDCTNGGISGRFNTLLLACKRGPWHFESEKETPLNLCMVERRQLFSVTYTDIIPAAINDAGEVVPRPGWWMFGGNIAYTSDNRFSEAVGHSYPLKIRDRRE
ncbi:MAG: hypothetical protein IJR00_08135 [Lachnospiraceae bacterium]|nr:hypothetical protein [Lachnospiraceae bacterium]